LLSIGWFKEKIQA